MVLVHDSLSELETLRTCAKQVCDDMGIVHAAQHKSTLPLHLQAQHRWLVQDATLPSHLQAQHRWLVQDAGPRILAAASGPGARVLQMQATGAYNAHL